MSRCFGLFCSLAIIFTVVVEPGFAESRYYNVSDVFWTGNSTPGTIQLLGGKSLTLPKHWPKGAEIHFEDPTPGANWKHQAYFHLVNPEGYPADTIVTQSPPRDWVELVRAHNTSPSIHQPNIRINPKHQFRLNHPAKHWALLINGFGEPRHWNDFSFLYKVLTTVYGYPKENIIIMDSVYLSRRPDLDGDGRADIGYGSTKKALRNVVNMLKNSMGQDHKLLLVVNDHGGRTIDDRESTLVMYDGEISASEFTKEFDPLRDVNTLAVFAQCYGGGFARPFLRPHRVVMAASMDLEISWARVNKQFDEFLYHWISSIGMQDHEGNPVDSDANHDGKISAHESFSYALASDKAPESPLIESYPNSGSAHRFFVGD